MSITIQWFALTLAVALTTSTLAPPTHARITRVVIDRMEPLTFEGASFGSVGQYEKLIGRAYGELDPKDALNSGMTYIDKPPG